MLALARELEIHVGKTYLVVNRVVGDLPSAFRDKIAALDVPLLAIVPYDAQLAEFDASGRPLAELPNDAPISQAVETIAQRLLTTNSN